MEMTFRTLIFSKIIPSLFVAAQLADGFNGADLRNVGTEAGLFAIRADRDYVLEVCLTHTEVLDATLVALMRAVFLD